MKSPTRHILLISAVLGMLAIGAGAFAWSGLYDIGADDAHTAPVAAMLQMARERSITARARRLHPPPNLVDAARIRQGAGNYDAMCTGCHLAPGMAETELSKGLYPAPPNLSRADLKDPSHHFWVIKHGIKASGMPAWGLSMSDEYIWNMVAFLQTLPKMTPAQYQTLVETSGGHEHGGGETEPHDDGPGAPAGHHDEEASDGHADMDMSMQGGQAASAKPGAHPHPSGTPAHDDKPAKPATTGMTTHRHADGTVESHPSEPAPPADDGHDHQH